jgi:hypothetical protein
MTWINLTEENASSTWRSKHFKLFNSHETRSSMGALIEWFWLFHYVRWRSGDTQFYFPVVPVTPHQQFSWMYSTIIAHGKHCVIFRFSKNKGIKLTREGIVRVDQSDHRNLRNDLHVRITHLGHYNECAVGIISVKGLG